MHTVMLILNCISPRLATQRGRSKWIHTSARCVPSNAVLVQRNEVGNRTLTFYGLCCLNHLPRKNETTVEQLHCREDINQDPNGKTVDELKGNVNPIMKQVYGISLISRYVWLVISFLLWGSLWGCYSISKLWPTSTATFVTCNQFFLAAQILLIQYPPLAKKRKTRTSDWKTLNHVILQ